MIHLIHLLITIDTSFDKHIDTTLDKLNTLDVLDSLDSLDAFDTLDNLDTLDILDTLDTLDTINTSYITCNGYYKTFKLFGHGRTDSPLLFLEGPLPLKMCLSSAELD